MDDNFCKKCEIGNMIDELTLTEMSGDEECPICFLTLPWLETGKRYQSCCGKIICSGCIHAGVTTTGKNMCPFCRALAPKTEEEAFEGIKRRVEVGNAQAMYELGCYYFYGRYGLPLNREKGLELWHQSAELGCVEAYYNIGNAYWYGGGVGRDEKKAIHFWELAAMGGDAASRHNLGSAEGRAGNIDRAMKHFMIAAGSGDHDSLKTIKQMYKDGEATKDDYAKALEAYQTYLSEIKSDDRDKAAAFHDEYKYYE